MALTPSNMLPLNTIAPDFSLTDVVTENIIHLNALKIERGLVMMFICNHCPFVKHILPQLVSVAATYQEKQIQFIAISSNDIQNYPDDAPEKMRELAQQLSFSFPYCFDETQAVAKSYQAACTPDFYLFDQDKKCVYRGRFDDATPGNNSKVTGKDLCAAMDNLLLNQPISSDQQPSMGCNIKWKK